MSTSEATDNTDNQEGCYLVYEPDSGGKLMLYYSKTTVSNAVGFWSPGPGKKIQGFKFNQNGGRVELIKGIAGGDANRKKYFVGWCQFIKAAKALNGSVVKYPNQGGVEVDVYGYYKSDPGPVMLELDDGPVNVTDLEGVAVLPKHNDIYKGVKAMNMTTFLAKSSTAGASTNL